MQTPTLSPRWQKRRILLAVFCTCLSVLLIGSIAVLSARIHERQATREADNLWDAAVGQYCDGSFDSASNALTTAIAFLDFNMGSISAYCTRVQKNVAGQHRNVSIHYDFGLMEFNAHSMLAYMMMCSRDTNQALFHLSCSYEYYKQGTERKHIAPTPRAGFVSFIIKQPDGADKANGVKWRSKLRLDSTVANSIQAAWVGGPPNPAD
jgi:hypothetical protein